MNIEKPDQISKGFIYACLGIGNKIPDNQTETLINQCSDEIIAVSKPRAIYREIQLIEGGQQEGSQNQEQLTEGQLFVGSKNCELKGNAIKQHLRNCSDCILMAVTLGEDVDKLLRKTQITNMASAVVMDACASSLIEDICDDINASLENQLKSEGKKLTSRFSPGYGDLPLETQKVFSEILNMEKEIGLTQSKEHLLLPRKSVTAIIGILGESDSNNSQKIFVGGDEKKQREKNCENACNICERKNQCSFRINGGHCGRI